MSERIESPASPASPGEENEEGTGRISRLLRLIQWTKLTFFFITLGTGILFQSGGLIIISLSLLVLIRLEKRLKIKIPTMMSVIFVLFIVASLILGERYGFYHRFPWWDTMLHVFYGGAFAIIGFLIIEFLSQRGDFHHEVAVICLFSFCFAVAGGAIWETFEYSADQLTGSNMQRTDRGNGVDDTMQDLIVESVSALAVNVFIYFYIKTGARNWVGRLSEQFMRLNKPSDA